MRPASSTQQLLDRIAARLRLKSMVRTGLLAFRIVSAVYLVVFVCSRCLGLLPDVFSHVRDPRWASGWPGPFSPTLPFVREPAGLGLAWLLFLCSFPTA